MSRGVAAIATQHSLRHACPPRENSVSWGFQSRPRTRICQSAFSSTGGSTQPLEQSQSMKFSHQPTYRNTYPTANKTNKRTNTFRPHQQHHQQHTQNHDTLYCIAFVDGNHHFSTTIIASKDNRIKADVIRNISKVF
mmetsp:Transcript_20110/g.41312  ORF Transcript_20110/g.41312 Transcript_20110/m.41312 type:complete len:137 (+) Transcript_20110:1141-1551(+)